MNHLELVRAALRGKYIVLIGGDMRRPCLNRLIRGFELRDAQWIPLSKLDPSSRRFKPALFRRDCALVVSMNGLSRTEHVREINQLCKSLGIPHVRAWRSPHPNSLAFEIVKQRVLGPNARSPST